MVKKEDLHWSDADTQAVEQYKKDVESGNIVPIQLTGDTKSSFTFPHLHFQPIKQEAWYLQIKDEISNSKRPIDEMSIAEIRKMYQENIFSCDTCGKKFEKNNFTLDEHITHLINPIVLWSCEDCIMKDLKQGNIVGATEEPEPNQWQSENV